MDILLILWPVLLFAVVGFVVGLFSWLFGGLGAVLPVYLLGKTLLFLSVLAGFGSLIGLIIGYVLIGGWVFAALLAVSLALAVFGLIRLVRSFKR